MAMIIAIMTIFICHVWPLVFPVLLQVWQLLLPFIASIIAITMGQYGNYHWHLWPLALPCIAIIIAI